jgi:hypothetical protein
VQISDQASLARASNALHDAVFRPEDIVDNQESGIFRISLWREVSELARTRRVALVLTRVETPRVRAELEVSQVTEAAIRVTDGVGFDVYCLEGIRHDRATGKIQFQVMGPLEIAITVKALCGSLRDIGEVTWEASDIPTFRIGG